LSVKKNFFSPQFGLNWRHQGSLLGKMQNIESLMADDTAESDEADPATLSLSDLNLGTPKL
jgi:hypothetical protein